MENIFFNFFRVITETNLSFSSIVKEIYTEVVIQIEDKDYKFAKTFIFDIEALQNFILFENLTKDIITNWIFQKYENDILELKRIAEEYHNEYKNTNKVITEIKKFNF